MEYKCVQWRQRTDASGIQHARRFGKWLDYVTVVYINHWPYVLRNWNNTREGFGTDEGVSSIIQLGVAHSGTFLISAPPCTRALALIPLQLR